MNLYLFSHDKAVQRAVKNAVGVPMTMAQTANGLWPTMLELAKIGNIACKSDLQVSEEIVHCIAYPFNT